MSITLVPFGAFACCILGQFYLADKAGRILSHRHPDVWRELSSNSLFAPNAVLRFAWRKRDLALGDAQLSVIASRMRKLHAIAFGVWLICMVVVFGSPKLIRL